MIIPMPMPIFYPVLNTPITPQSAKKILALIIAITIFAVVSWVVGCFWVRKIEFDPMDLPYVSGFSLFCLYAEIVVLAILLLTKYILLMF